MCLVFLKKVRILLQYIKKTLSGAGQQNCHTLVHKILWNCAHVTFTFTFAQKNKKYAIETTLFHPLSTFL